MTAIYCDLDRSFGRRDEVPKKSGHLAHRTGHRMRHDENTKVQDRLMMLHDFQPARPARRIGLTIYPRRRQGLIRVIGAA